MSVVFDKLSFVKRLEDAANFSRPQAEALSDAFHQAVSETVATKQDVALTRVELQQSIDGVRSEVNLVRSEVNLVRSEIGVVRSEVGGVRSELQNEIAVVRSEIKAGLAETKVWTVSVGATIIAVLAAMKYFG